MATQHVVHVERSQSTKGIGRAYPIIEETSVALHYSTGARSRNEEQQTSHRVREALQFSTACQNQSSARLRIPRARLCRISKASEILP